MAENISRVTDTILEKPQLFRFGILFVLAKPLTLAQMYEIGALVEKTEGLELEGSFNPVAKMLSNYKDIDLCTKVAIIALFRSSIARTIFGWYIRRHMTMARYKSVINYSASCFGAAFFLTSFTFLKGTKEMTKMTNTEGAIRSGDSSEE